MSDYQLKHREVLLAELSAELLRQTREYEKAGAWVGEVRVDHIRVRFMAPDGEILKEAQFAYALDWVVSGVYWDESGDWSETVHVEFPV